MAVQQGDKIDPAARLSELKARFAQIRNAGAEYPQDDDADAIMVRISRKLAQAEELVKQAQARKVRQKDRVGQIAELKARAQAITDRIAARRGAKGGS